jgi:hypothetical protein
MAADTATIRVTRETRDLLASQARERGMSLSAMLEELAHDAAREAMFHSEREASRADSSNREARDEEKDWESALSDGI